MVTLTDILLLDRTTETLMDIDVRRVLPRHLKPREVQKNRTRSSAEVFTPSWICNAQNNLIDNAYFGREGVFNTEDAHIWHTNPNPIAFPDGKTWKDYVNEIVLEITCGEAPYLVSRYDTTSGKTIPVPNRIGLLDRKLRVVSENTDNEYVWIDYAIKAVEATYGYEYQQDSLWLARKNIVQSVKEHFKNKFRRPMPHNSVLLTASVVSWNVFRMDGLKMTIPNTCSPFCIGCKQKGIAGIHQHDGIYAKIMNWNTGDKLEFRELSANNSHPTLF